MIWPGSLDFSACVSLKASSAAQRESEELEELILDLCERTISAQADVNISTRLCVYMYSS